MGVEGRFYSSLLPVFSSLKGQHRQKELQEKTTFPSMRAELITDCQDGSILVCRQNLLDFNYSCKPICFRSKGEGTQLASLAIQEDAQQVFSNSMQQVNSLVSCQYTVITVAFVRVYYVHGFCVGWWRMLPRCCGLVPAFLQAYLPACPHACLPACLPACLHACLHARLSAICLPAICLPACLLHDWHSVAGQPACRPASLCLFFICCPASRILNLVLAWSFCPMHTDQRAFSGMLMRLTLN